MAARVLLQRRAAPLTAALLVGSIAFTPLVAHAESPEERHSKKPIYDDNYDYFPPPKPAQPTTTPTTTIPSTPADIIFPSATTASNEPATRSPTPTARLASQIRHGRLFLYRQACLAEDAINNTMTRAFSLEESFTSTIASLAPPRESGERVMPGLIYVLVAGMAGSIVARNRNILLRASAPLALGIGAAWVVLPVTMGNVSDLAWRYEQKFPAVVEAHVKTREGIERGVRFARVHAELGREKVREKVGDVRGAVEEWVRKGK